MARYPKKTDNVSIQEPIRATTQAAPEPAPVKERTLVRAIHGRMVDPTDNASYDQAPTLVTKLTNWMKSQIAAKKMEVV